MSKIWDTYEIKTDSGQIVTGIAPIIISASRATDIPAFFSRWFLNRLAAGYLKWYNPFNRLAPQYVSFRNVRAIVFWSKNPAPMMPFLEELNKRGINYYFQFTLNDYEKEGLEPNVPSLEKRIETFISLSQKIGQEKVIWRYDPLLLSENLSVEILLQRILRLGERLLPYTEKLVFSFADVLQYKKVTSNLLKVANLYNKTNIQQAEFQDTDKIRFAEKLSGFIPTWRKISPAFKVATCAENIDLSSYGIEHNKCIDDELLIRLFPDDEILMKFVGYSPSLFSIRPDLKDRGQRKACGCIVSKDIGAYNTCRHLCIYCYANSSRKEVLNNQVLMNIESDSLLPS